jgi:hypothetical protein
MTFAYHCQGTITHLLCARKQDFIELGLHHLICLILYCGCYMINVAELSASFGLMHDIADLPLAFTKILAETKYKLQTALLFTITTCIWAWTRCIALPVIVYQIYEAPNPGWHQYFVPFFTLYCVILNFLHFVWLRMFVLMIGKFVKEGSTDDTVGGVESKKVKETKKDI